LLLKKDRGEISNSNCSWFEAE